MILITIDNNKDFMRLRMNKSRSSVKRKKGFFAKLFTPAKGPRKPLMPAVF